MKKLLIGTNAVLAFLLLISLWGAFSGGDDVKLEVGKKKNRNKTTAAAIVPPPAKFKVPASDEAVAVIVRKNVFDTQRTGGAAGGRGAATYTLVGIYRVNNTRGAIIKSQGGPRRGNMPIKQFFRVGDELPNGYTLSSVSNNQAVLMRGASRMTLDLAPASAGNTVRSNIRRSVNPMQQMVNLMQQSIGMQQRQQMNMMRMMQQNNQSNSNSRGSTRRGR